MKRVVRGSEGERRVSHNCFSGSVCYILEKHGLPLSEHFAFGLSKGYCFEMSFTNEVQFTPVRTLHCLTEFLEQLGLTVTPVERDVDKIIDFIKDQVDRDIPVMFEYDGFYIPFTQIYNKIHEKRIGLVIGYEADALIVSDFVYKVYHYTVPISQFLASHNKGQGACADSIYYEIQFPKELSSKITEEMVAEAVIDVSRNMLVESKSEHWVGVQGIERFSRNLQALWSDQVEDIKIDWASLMLDLKKFSVTTSQYAEFIKSINDIYYDSAKTNLQVISNRLADAGRKWEVMCNLLLRLSISRSQDEEAISKVSHYAYDVHLLTKDSFSELVKDFG